MFCCHFKQPTGFPEIKTHLVMLFLPAKTVDPCFSPQAKHVKREVIFGTRVGSADVEGTRLHPSQQFDPIGRADWMCDSPHFVSRSVPCIPQTHAEHVLNPRRTLADPSQHSRGTLLRTAARAPGALAESLQNSLLGTTVHPRNPCKSFSELSRNSEPLQQRKLRGPPQSCIWAETPLLSAVVKK